MKESLFEGSGEDRAGGTDGKRWREYHASVQVCICSNVHKAFAKVEIVPALQNCNRTVFCFLAGRRGGGWSLLAEAMGTSVGVVVRERQLTTLVDAVRNNNRNGAIKANRTFVEALRGKPDSGPPEVVKGCGW